MVTEKPPKFTVRQEQGCKIITAAGPEIELESKDELYALAERPAIEAAAEPWQVILNLEKVRDYKSAILGVLVQLQKKVVDGGGKLKLVCNDPDVVTMFRITKLDLVLDFHRDESLAIMTFGNHARRVALSR